MSEWIKVEDRLPELADGSYSSRDVLVCVIANEGTSFEKGTKYIGIDRLVKIRNIPNIDFRTHHFQYGVVTHWREAPDLPHIEES